MVVVLLLLLLSPYSAYYSVSVIIQIPKSNFLFPFVKDSFKAFCLAFQTLQCCCPNVMP